MATPEATVLGGDVRTIPHTLAADAASGEVILLPDDRAGIVTGLDTAALTSGKTTQVIVGGPVRIKKANGVNLSSTKEIFWDVSADTAIAGAGATGDFAVGTRIGGGASGDLYVDVDLNADVGSVT